ncbi:MAG: type VI secretion system domain-containing protein [Campylobacteraceae bacterium]|nr:type VI secretion system domain-containing protein [Campylobacteraceae bacterium]
MIEKYKSDLYPKSQKAKKNTILWLETTLSKDILKTKKNDILNPKDLLKDFELLQNLFIDMFDENSIYFGKIIRHIKKFDEEIEVSPIPSKNVEIKKAEKIEIKKEEKPSASTGNLLNIKEISNKDEANKIVFLFKKHASMLNEYYRSENSYDLRAIKITRLLSWLNTDGLPQSNKNITFINPPSALNINKIDDLIGENKNDEAFVLIQQSLEKSPFWIDGHYKAYELLISQKKDKLALEIKNYVRAFVNTNNGVSDLLFKDESAFASDETKNFLNISSEEKITSISKKEENVEIQNNLNQQNIKDAMEELQKDYDLSSSMQDKFKIRLEQSKLAISNKEFTMALILLDELEKNIEKYNLDEWQPELSTEVYALILKNLFKEYINNDRLKNAFEKLCKINISKALNLNIGEIK